MTFAQQTTTRFETGDDSSVIEGALARFFSMCNDIVGHEAN